MNVNPNQEQMQAAIAYRRQQNLNMIEKTFGYLLGDGMTPLMALDCCRAILFKLRPGPISTNLMSRICKLETNYKAIAQQHQDQIKPEMESLRALVSRLEKEIQDIRATLAAEGIKQEEDQL